MKLTAFALLVLAGVSIVSAQQPQQGVGGPRPLTSAAIENAPHIEKEMIRQLGRDYEQAERNAARIAKELREFRSNEKPDIGQLEGRIDSLRDNVKRAFHLRMRIQMAQLANAEAKLKATRDRLARRAQIADAIIARRIQELESGEETSWVPVVNANASSLVAVAENNDFTIQATKPTKDTEERYSSYQMYLRDELGALRQYRDDRLECITDIQQELVELQSEANRFADESPQPSADRLKEKAKIEARIKTLSLQITALRELLVTADEKIAMLQKKLLNTRQENSDFVAVQGVVTAVVDGRVNLSIGSQRGVEKGMRLKVFRDELFVQEVEVVEVQPESSVCIVSDSQSDGKVLSGDVAILLLDPRLHSIVGVEPGESIFNDEIKRFKFHVPYAKGSSATVGQRFMRRYFGNGYPPVYGMWGDPSTDSLIVIAPAASETAIREFLVQGEVFATTGFDGREGETLESQRRELSRRRKSTVFEIASRKQEIIDLEAMDQPDQKKLAALQSELQEYTNRLEVLDRKLKVVNELADADDSGGTPPPVK